MSTFLLMLIRFRLITKVQKIGKSELKNKNFLLHNLKSCLSPSPIWRLGWACQLYGGVHPFFDAIVEKKELKIFKVTHSHSLSHNLYFLHSNLTLCLSNTLANTTKSDHAWQDLNLKCEASEEDHHWPF